MRKTGLFILLTFFSLTTLNACISNENPKTVSIKYTEKVGDKLQIPTTDYGGNYTYTFPSDHIITDKEYDGIYHEVNSYIPNNQGGYYVFRGFYDNLDVTSNTSFQSGYCVKNDITFYYTYIGGSAQPTYSLSIIDEDNYIYDKPQNNYFSPYTILKFHSYPVMDANLAMYVNGRFISIQESIQKNEGYIWEFTLTMPAADTTIKFDIAPNYDLRTLYPWISDISVSDIWQVRHEKAYIGVAPGSLTTISYSTNQVDITNAYNYLSTPLTPISDALLTGGFYEQYDYYTNSNEIHTIKINNEIVKIDGQYFHLINDSYEFVKSDSILSSFITYVDTCDIYSNVATPVKISTYQELQHLEITPVNSNNIEGTSPYYLNSEFGIIYIHDKDTIYLQNEKNITAYKIVGSNNFSFLFE